ncbi:MAG: PQQ-binding-like beta-propeller repeat protein [Bryobacteraceae bacterium]
MRSGGKAAALALAVAAAGFAQTGASPTPAAPPVYGNLCAGCHGDSLAGTDRGPGLVESRSLRRRSSGQIRDLIRNGTSGGMPAFPLPGDQLDALAEYVRAFNVSAFEAPPSGDPGAGERFFFGKGNCGGCHMVRGRGKANGPDLSAVGRQLTLREIEAMLDDPASQSGSRSAASCPGWAFCPQAPWRMANVELRDGTKLRGFARSEGKHDVILQTPDGRIHTLTDTQYRSLTFEAKPIMPALAGASAAVRRDLLAYLARLGGVTPGPVAGEVEPVTEAEQRAVLHPARGEWPGYHGLPSGNRHSTLEQIDTQNAGRLQLQWSYSIPYNGLEATPVVSDGVMYMSGPNQVCALSARTGRELWCYVRARTAANTIAGDAAKGATRGVALLGDRVFFATDNAHLLCLHRLTGALLWETVMPKTAGKFGATAAPMVVNDLVISGMAGGDGPLLGFLVAYRATTGEEVWRFRTIPQPGEPGSETWQGKAIETGGGATWLTGSYDPESGLLYWPTGNPFPDTDGDERGGDNLYTNCVVALEAKTGKLRWHFQYTPHDLHDWDATEPLVLVDARFRGRDRKLLLQANRNGFYYVLDRTTGEFLLGEAFVNNITWASGIGKDGRPVLLPGNEPTAAGTRTCPAVRGATNWYSTAYHPGTRLFYVMAVEDCNLYRKAGFGGYIPLHDPANPPAKFLRALDIETGKIAWEIRQAGPPEANYSGVLSTDGGLVFYGETGGTFAAVDARNGKTLWHFPTGQQWKASPMTYTVDGKQYVAIAAGGNVLAFALP